MKAYPFGSIREAVDATASDESLSLDQRVRELGFVAEELKGLRALATQRVADLHKRENGDDLARETARLKHGDYVSVSVVGESHYQDALRSICGRENDEDVRLEYLATLVPEPENPYDPHAVRVDIDGMTVGYLSKGEAPSYQSQVARMIEEGGDPSFPVFIGGPEGSLIGVVLHIPKESPLEVPLSRV